MDADQWARVTVEAHPSGQGWKLECSVQCDRLEDGLCACLWALCERFPEAAIELLK